MLINDGRGTPTEGASYLLSGVVLISLKVSYAFSRTRIIANASLWMNMSVDVLFLCLTACVKGSTCREFLLTGRAASVVAPRPVVTESLRTKIRKVFIPFRRSRTESVFSEPVESFFFRWWENPVSASGFSSSPTDFPVALMETAVSVGATFMSPACAPLCPAVFSSVCVETAVSVGATFMSPASVRCRGLAVCVSPFRRRAS